jgi:hypothetical protein
MDSEETDSPAAPAEPKALPPIPLMSSRDIRTAVKGSSPQWSAKSIEFLADLAGIQTYTRGDMVMIPEPDARTIIDMYRRRIEAGRVPGGKVPGRPAKAVAAPG